MDFPSWIQTVLHLSSRCFSVDPYALPPVASCWYTLTWCPGNFHSSSPSFLCLVFLKMGIKMLYRHISEISPHQWSCSLPKDENPIQFFPNLSTLLPVICQVHCSFPTSFRERFSLCNCNLYNAVLYFCLLSISSFLLDSPQPSASGSIQSISPRLYWSIVHSSIWHDGYCTPAMIPVTMYISHMPTYWYHFPFDASKFTTVWELPIPFACMDVCFHTIYVALHTVLDPYQQ